MRFGPRELVLLFVLLAIPLSSYWLVFRPQNEKIQQARQEITHKREMLERLRGATSQNESLDNANEEIASQIRSTEAKLPTHKQVPSVVRQVTDLATEAGLDEPAITAEKPVPAADYMEQPLKMELTGDWHGFYDFVVGIEQLLRITRLPDLHIERSQDVNGYLEAEFTLSIYFQDEGAAP